MQTLAGAEVDALQELGDEIATLAAHVHAATYRLLMLIVEFDRRRGWQVDGYRSCAHWLAFRCGLDPGTAREKVRASRALRRLPEISAAMARGELSFAKVRSLTRVARAETESELLAFARTNTAAQLERIVRGYSRRSRMDEAKRERMHHQLRCLSVFPDDDGMYLIRGKLDPEVGALLMRAIEAASDALFTPETAGQIEPTQRRADAIGLLAERALAAGFGGDMRMDDDDEVLVSTDRDATTAAPHDATTADRAAAPAPVSGTRAQRYQVVLHVEPATLAWGRDPGRSELEDGTRASAETSRRLSCDASVVRVQHGHNGAVLDVGRKTRTIPPALRRALEVRDRGCRFPGCGLRFTDAHHVIHWADGGRTNLSNTMLLCRFHHRLVHEEGFRVELVGDYATFYNARGLPVPDTPPLARTAEHAAEELVRQNRQRGIEPDHQTSAARYRREDDIPWPLIVQTVDALEASVAGT